MHLKDNPMVPTGRKDQRATGCELYSLSVLTFYEFIH